MTYTLHLGVLDVPYSENVKGKSAKKHHAASTQTTGEVAEILEAKYGVMDAFYQAHDVDILKTVENSMAGHLESMMMGARVNPEAMFQSANSKIEGMFKEFLSSQEVERLGIPGVPTEAARMGVSHRFAKPRAKRAPRPSFIDTGLYQSSFKAWID